MIACPSSCSCAAHDCIYPGPLRLSLLRTLVSVCLFFGLVWLRVCAQGLARTQELIEGSKTAVANVLSQGKSEADIQVLKERYSLVGCEW